MEDLSALSPAQRKARAKMYEEQAAKLREAQSNYEFGESKVQPTESTKSASILIINFSFVAFGICGIIGSFWDAFDMQKYVSFLETFAWVWAPLVIAVGGGRAFKNYVSKKYESPPAE